MSNPNTPDGNHEFERKDVLFGAQVHASRTMKAGAKITLEIDPFGVFSMEVRLCKKPDVGLKFNEDSTKVAELVMATATYA
jgi:hypothetical protein